VAEVCGKLPKEHDVFGALCEVLYSVSHGLREIPFSLAEYAKKGAVLIPTQRM
jgi:hypothetical protein